MFVFMFSIHTRVNDLLFLAEGHSRASPLPLGSLDVQVSLLDGESRDALVVRCVELSQVLHENISIKMRTSTSIWLSPRRNLSFLCNPLNISLPVYTQEYITYI